MMRARRGETRKFDAIVQLFKLGGRVFAARALSSKKLEDERGMVMMLCRRIRSSRIAVRQFSRVRLILQASLPLQ